MQRAGRGAASPTWTLIGPRRAAEWQLVRRLRRLARSLAAAQLFVLPLTVTACIKGGGEPASQSITQVELSANSYWSGGHDWWRVVYRSDRTCEWIGNIETERKGQYVGVLEPAEWERVVTCIEMLGIEQLLSHYADDAHDARHLLLTIYRGAESKTVDDYNSAGPPEMRSAESILLTVADQVAWRERPQ